MIRSASSFFPRGIGCFPWFAPHPDSPLEMVQFQGQVWSGGHGIRTFDLSRWESTFRQPLRLRDMSAAASASRNRCMRNHRTTRRRTFSVSAARSAWVIGRAGRNAAGPSPAGTKTPSVALGSQVHVVIDRRSEAVQKGDGTEPRSCRCRETRVARRGCEPSLHRASD
jgi:hypothetical protein